MREWRILLLPLQKIISKQNKMDIKRIMKQKGITFEQLATKMGQTKGTLSASIGKGSNPTLKKLETIAGHLNCNVADFFEDEKSMNGYVEYCGSIYRIRSVEDLKSLLALVEAEE